MVQFPIIGPFYSERGFLASKRSPQPGQIISSKFDAPDLRRFDNPPALETGGIERGEDLLQINGLKKTSFGWPIHGSTFAILRRRAH